jgi:hypothetical protein
VRPFRENLVVAAECTFYWYWLADLCAAEGIEFVLGHALYMRAIHGGKAKNDEQIQQIELYLEQNAKLHDPEMFYLLRSIPGVGKILALC